MLHAPVIIALYLAYRGLPQHPIALSVLLTVTGLVATYLLAGIARQIPGAKYVL